MFSIARMTSSSPYSFKRAVKELYLLEPLFNLDTRLIPYSDSEFHASTTRLTVSV